MEEDNHDNVMDDLIDASLETANSGPAQAKRTLGLLKTLSSKIQQVIRSQPADEPKVDEPEPEATPPAITYEPEEPAAEPATEEPPIKESVGDLGQIEDLLLLINQMKEQANPAMQAMIDTLTASYAKQIEAVKSQSYSAGVQAGREQVVTEYASLDEYVNLMLERLPLKENNKKMLVATIKSIFQDDNISAEDAKSFLEAAAEGKVIDMVALLKAGQGNIINFVRPNLVKTFKKVIDDFFKLDLGSSTGGNIGPGEIAFILLGNPVAKVKKGDLQIGEGDAAEKFEIKSSGIKASKGKSGSVFGGDHISTAKALWPEIKKILGRYGIHHTEEIKVKDGKSKKSPLYKLNSKGLSQYNDTFRNNQMSPNTIASLMADIALTLYPDTETRNVMAKRVAKILKANDGYLDTDNNGGFMRLLTRLALNAYRKDEGKENFIYFNQTSKNFHVYMGDELDQELESPKGDLEVMRGIDWNDGQYKASPGLYLK